MLINKFIFCQFNFYISDDFPVKRFAVANSENYYFASLDRISADINNIAEKKIYSPVSLNKIEFKVGMDLNRRDFCGFFGYNIPIKKNFEFLPEINFPLIPSISSSIRYNIILNNNFKIYLQSGIGMTFLLGRYFEYIFSSGANIKLYKNYHLTIETRIYLIESNNETENRSTGNNRMLDIIKYPPTYFSLGITF